MSNITRRAALVGAAAAGAAGTLPTPASAQAAPAAVGRQAAGYYRYKIGDFEVTTINDGVRNDKLERSPYPNVKLEDVQAALRAHFLPTDQMSIPFNTTLVNTGSKLVLLDTGNGPGRSPATGLVAANLAAAGVDPKTIDTVVISHFHGDHIGGLRTADGQLAFPNAEIKVPAKEWAYWLDDANMSRAPEGSNLANNHRNVRRIFGSIADKVTRYEWGSEVAPGITALDTNGHTSGHTSFLVASGPGKLIVQADVTAHVALLFVRNPGWNAGGDMDGPQAVATRRKLYDMLATDRILLSGYHLPFPAAGYIEKDGTGYRFTPVAWSPVL
jgi:glyoxylase-like metal-dependent hydrolase (beta-lactamase superfamily II)